MKRDALWELGQRVKSEVRLVRKSQWTGRWNAWSYVWERQPEPVSGILIGLRHLQSGISDGEGWEAKEYVPCALIVSGLRRRPIPVPLAALEAEEGAEG